MKLKAKKREITGKKVKQLRSNGEIPASVFGPNMETINLSVNPKEFKTIFSKVEYNKLFDLEVGEDKPFKVLVKEIQHDPVRDTIMHIGFYQIDTKKKLYVDVPINYIGESIAVKNNIGFMVTLFESLHVHCLPLDIPSEITIDLSKLENVNDAVHIGDIQLPEGVEWDANLSHDTVVVRVAPPQKEVVEAVVETEEAEGEAKEGEEKEGEKKAE